MGAGWRPSAAGQDLPLSSYFIGANRGKKSVEIDLTKPGAQQVVRDLAAICDVMVENFKVGDLARYGLDYAAIRKVNPGIVYCSITGFGQTGPYAPRPGTDSVFQAMSGMMSITGEPGQPPTKIGLIISDLITGLFATVIGPVVAGQVSDWIAGEGATGLRSVITVDVLTDDFGVLAAIPATPPL